MKVEIPSSASLTKQKWFKYSYLLVFVIIGVIKFYRATIYRNYINTNHPYMEVRLLSQFSNYISFNIWTFLALLSFIGFISFWTKKNLLKKEEAKILMQILHFL